MTAVGVLGPLVVVNGADPVPVPRRAGAVLAALTAGYPYATDRDALVEAVWPTDRPATAVNTLQVHVSGLRKLLGTSAVVREGNGYRLAVDAGQVDAHRFLRLVQDAEALPEPGARSTRLTEALGLWRGPAYVGFEDVDVARVEAARLEALRLMALELRADADLDSGRAGAVAAELEVLVGRHPLRERFWEQLILAQYRAGRTDRSLDAYQRARRVLSDELGVEPGEPLRQLEAAVLRQDPALHQPGDRISAAASDAAGEVTVPVRRLPLAGRDEDLAWLLAGVRSAHAAPSTLVVTGVRGAGKSRLLDELAALLATQRPAPRLVRGAGVRALSALRAGPEGTERTGHPAGPRHVVLVDDLDELPGAAAPDLRELLEPRVGRVVVAALGRDTAPLPLRVAVESMVSTGEARVRGLGPLDVSAVTALTRQIHPHLSEAEVTAFAAQVAPSLPADAAEQASEWALTRSAQRVADAVRDQSPRRSSWQHGRDELVSSLVDLTHTMGRDAAALPGRCPYQGLVPFGEADSAVFFGRERVVAQLLARLAEQPLTVLVGPSGAGKSSLLRAGLVSALRAGALPGSAAWRIDVVNAAEPGSPRPWLEGLTMAGGSPAPRLLVVDQAELALATSAEGISAGWLELVAELCRAGVRVVVAVRSDFFGSLAQAPQLDPWLTDAVVALGPLDDADMRRVIESPAVVTGLRLEPGLVDTLLADTGQDAGALPLLSSALLAVWERRLGAKLTLDGYRDAGGVAGAVTRLAEDGWVTLTADERAAAPRVLVRLVMRAQDGAPLARRVPLDELGASVGSLPRQVVERLAGCRLLVVDEAHVTVAHEALLRHWPRLHQLLDADRAGQRLREHLTPAAASWHESGRPPAELYRGPRLLAAQDYARSPHAALSTLEHEFVRASSQHAEGDLLRSRRSRRRLSALAGGLAVLLLVSVALGAFTADQRSVARRQAVVADADRLAALASDQAGRRADLALLLAVEGFRRHRSVATRGGLFTALGQHTRLRAMRPQPVAGAQDIALTADGRTVVTVDHPGTVHVHRIAQNGSAHRVGEPLRLVAGDSLSILAMSPDGLRVAVGRLDGVVAVVDVRAATVLATAQLPARTAALAWTTDMRHLVVVTDTGVVLEYDPSSLTTPRRVTRVPAGPESAPPVLAVSPDGSRLAVGAPAIKAVLVLDASSGREVARLPDGGDGTTVLSVAFSPDSRQAAVGTYDGRVLLAEADGSGTVTTLDAHPGSMLMALAFTPDGARLVTAAGDGELGVWDPSNGQRVGLPLSAAHSGYVQDLTVGSDGTVLSADAQQLATWHLSPQLPGDSARHRPVSGLTDLAAAAGTVFAGARPGALTADGEHVSLPPDAGDLDQLVLASSSDGRLVAVSGLRAGRQSSPGAPVVVLDARSREPVRTLRAGADAVLDLEFSPDGRFLALAEDGNLELADLRDGSVRQLGPALRRSQRRPATDLGVLRALTFTPDGGQLLAGSVLGVVYRWEIRTKQALPALAADPSGVADLAFSAGGQLAVVTIDGAVRIGRPGSRMMSAVPVVTGAGVFAEATFDDRGSLLAVTGADGTLRLVDASSRRPLGLPAVVAVADMPIGLAPIRHPGGILLGSSDGQVMSMSVDAGEWARAACAKVGRNLSRQEWQQYVGGSYQRTCRRWPAG